MAEEDDLSQLEELLQAHVDAANMGDVGTLLDQLTDDAVYLGSSIPEPVIGKDQFEPGMRAFHASNEATLEMTPRERVIHGDIAHEWGTLTMEIRSKEGGEVLQVKAKYFYLYRKGSDGRWRISHDVVIEDVPSSETPTSVD